MMLTYLGLALLSAAALAFEITLTRLFSVTQWYHFAFLAVSVALLGYGASGTALSLVPRWTQPPTARRTSLLSAFFAAAVVGAYLSLNRLPFDSYRIAWERIQVLYLVLYYLALAVPFFCAGLVTGLLLATYPDRSARLYAANLLGSALGGLVPLLVLPLVGEGAVLVIAALGLLAAIVFSPGTAEHQLGTSAASQTPPPGKRSLPPGTTEHQLGTGAAGRTLQPGEGSSSSRGPQGGARSASGLVARISLGLAACSLLLAAWHLPTPFQLSLSPYKGLSQVLQFPGAEVTWQRWNAFSRVDRVASSAIRSAPGPSLSYPGELPTQDGLFVDGEDLSPVIETPDLSFTSFLPVALPYQLRPGGRALILEPGGGLDVNVALSQGAASVVAVASNSSVIEAAGSVYRDPRVQVVIETGRSYAGRSRETFDVVQLSLTDSYRPVASGAYSLGERYDLTAEAFQDYLARLSPDGLLVVERWLQLPPSETLRARAVAVKALRRSGVEDPAAQLAVLRDWQVGLILVKNGALSSGELAAIRAFAHTRGLDLVALPGLAEAETNLFNVLEEPVYYRVFRQLLVDPEALYRTHPYDVRPPTDDRPFFFHFFRWAQTRAILQQLGKTWQPWGGSGYFVLVALLAVAVLASLVLILLPLARGGTGQKGQAGPRGRALTYFGLLGLGFLFVEIPLLQQFILFLGQPIYAFTTVLAAILLFSGLGSLAAQRISPRWSLPLLILAILVYPLALPLLFRTFLGAPLAVRLLAVGISLAPLGFLMGIPFPSGLAWLRLRAPALIPWAWAVNGCGSVLASILATMVALGAGFSWVLVAAAVAYAGAWLVLR